MKILFVPDWMMAALEAANVPRSQWYCPKSLKSTLSAQDVAFYILYNQELERAIPKAIALSFEKVDFSNGLASEQDVADCLQNYQINDSSVKLDTDGKQLTCELFDENTILFTHIPVEAASSPAPKSLLTTTEALLDRVIRQLYAFEPFEVVVKLPVTAAYLALRRASIFPTGSLNRAA